MTEPKKARMAAGEHWSGLTEEEKLLMLNQHAQTEAVMSASEMAASAHWRNATPEVLQNARDILSGTQAFHAAPVAQSTEAIVLALHADYVERTERLMLQLARYEARIELLENSAATRRRQFAASITAIEHRVSKIEGALK